MIAQTGEKVRHKSALKSRCAVRGASKPAAIIRRESTALPDANVSKNRPASCRANDFRIHQPPADSKRENPASRPARHEVDRHPVCLQSIMRQTPAKSAKLRLAGCRRSRSCSPSRRKTEGRFPSVGGNGRNLIAMLPPNLQPLLGIGQPARKPQRRFRLRAVPHHRHRHARPNSGEFRQAHQLQF